MGFFDKITEPIFIKEDSEAENQLVALREIQSQLSGEGTEEGGQGVLLRRAGSVFSRIKRKVYPAVWECL